MAKTKRLITIILASIGFVVSVLSFGKDLVYGLEQLVRIVDIWRGMWSWLFTTLWPESWAVPRQEAIDFAAAFAAAFSLSSIINDVKFGRYLALVGFVVFAVLLSIDGMTGSLRQTFIVSGLAMGLSAIFGTVKFRPKFRIKTDWKIAYTVFLLVPFWAIFELNARANTALPIAERWADAYEQMWADLESMGKQ